jgi:DNA-binding LytR/AlgR family response regulator
MVTLFAGLEGFFCLNALRNIQGDAGSADDFVVLTDNIKCCILRMSDLLRLEAEGNYSRVYWIGSSMLIRRPLRDCEKWPDRQFCARRDCIVNLEHEAHRTSI